MAWMSVATCLIIGGCAAGFTLGNLHSNKDGGGNNHPIQQVIRSTELESKKKQLLDKLGKKWCHVNSQVKDINKRYGTIYVCGGGYTGSSGIPLYYLEEENKVDFDKLETNREVISILREIGNFQYKRDGDSDPYLFFVVGGQSKKVFVDSSDSEDWNLYKGFSNRETSH